MSMEKCDCGLDPQRIKEAWESKEKAIDEFIFAQQQDRKLLTKYREALSVAREALDRIRVSGVLHYSSHHSRKEFQIYLQAKQKIEEILTKENENEN